MNKKQTPVNIDLINNVLLSKSIIGNKATLSSFEKSVLNLEYNIFERKFILKKKTGSNKSISINKIDSIEKNKIYSDTLITILRYTLVWDE